MSNKDGSGRVVCNGEGHNHADLRREREAAGHDPRLRCGAQALVHGYGDYRAGRRAAAYGRSLPACSQYGRAAEESAYVGRRARTG